MGDAAVSALVKEVVGRLASFVVQEFSLLRGLKDDISRLEKDFEQIVTVLEDAEEKRIKEREVQVWLKSLKSAKMEVENVLDEISTEALLQRLHKKRGLIYRVRAFFSSDDNMLMFRVRIAHKIKAMRTKLDVIKADRSKLRLTPGAISHVDVDSAGEMPNRETSSLVHDSASIFGRDEEREMVTEMICNNGLGKYENGEILVYCIWGMGGLGKTTLAQLVYNHERVNQYFEIKCWVYVSEKFNVIEIIKKIMESVDSNVCQLTQLNMLEVELQKKLSEKKFLIVLDDVWVEENEKPKWDELSKTLSCGAEGSIVLMTTRSQKTSQIMAKVKDLQHKLGCLSEEDSWSLFKKFAFAQGRDGDDISVLEHAGREIVEKCKGLPLAVKTLGSLMWSKKSASDWEHVKGSIIWELQENEVLPALKLSYDNLPLHLKRCFAYCCLIPKGYPIGKDDLIQLWVVNGFIPPIEGKDLYKFGEEILNCLVWRSFFQLVETKEDDYTYTWSYLNDLYMYKMHDLMHDMALHVMGDDCLVIEPTTQVKIPNEVFHLNSSCPEFVYSPHILRNLTSLRSIFMSTKINQSHCSQIFNHMYLRVLRVCCHSLGTLPESIGKLKHLRYLNLSGLRIEVLPESIIYLQNLQVLILNGCYNLRKLPKRLRYMVNLQCLDIFCFSLHQLPYGIKLLTSLRILSKFPIAKEGGAQIGELGDLNLLERELNIEGLDNVRGFSEAKSANLKCKSNLSVLQLRWDNKQRRRRGVKYDEKEVLAGLEPNPGLKGLGIHNYTGKIISPSWMVNLKNLIRISFFNCEICEHIPPLGRLPNLRAIELIKMKCLKWFHDDDTNMLRDNPSMFLSLQTLYINGCSSLVSLPSNLPKLKILSLYHCRALVSLPDEILKDLNELEIYNCIHLSERYTQKMGKDWPKVSHIPDITIFPKLMKMKTGE